MARRPNLWFFIPVVAGAVVGAALGWMIVGVSCATCVVSKSVVAVLGGLVTGGGVGVVMVLAIRSMDEFRAASARGEAPPIVGCEAPADEE